MLSPLKILATAAVWIHYEILIISNIVAGDMLNILKIFNQKLGSVCL